MYKIDSGGRGGGQKIRFSIGRTPKLNIYCKIKPGSFINKHIYTKFSKIISALNEEI